MSDELEKYFHSEVIIAISTHSVFRAYSDYFMAF